MTAVTTTGGTTTTGVDAPATGVVWIHSTPSALCPHIEWALGGVLGVPTRLDWSPQPADRGSYRAELEWRGPAGTAATIASSLQRWGRLRFEVTEHQPGTDEGVRYSVTPRLGVFHATIGRHGDVLVHEQRLRAALVADALNRASLHRAVADLLGLAWDEELELFRQAGADGPRWLERHLA
ncbi:DUF3145 domain-containing protein [Aestuariimicrobium ganziense]|uniref:DUF3145 domain-containing protein n=1 Tax=Aestuariimicrobium ganziense TaxID=2773677 RepID=UPI0019425D93|nr:DUF3145 domain-containing protein [Aestuariimicrobium ganziense]